MVKTRRLLFSAGFMSLLAGFFTQVAVTQPTTGTQTQYCQTPNANNLTYPLAMSSSLNLAPVIPVPWPVHGVQRTASCRVSGPVQIYQFSNRHGVLMPRTAARTSLFYAIYRILTGSVLRRYLNDTTYKYHQLF